MMYYDFWVGISDKEYNERLRLAFGHETPSYTSAFRWHKEFQRGRTSLYDEGLPRSADAPENVATVKAMTTSALIVRWRTLFV